MDAVEPLDGAAPLNGAAPVEVGGTEDYGCCEEEDAIAAMMMINGTNVNEAAV